MTGLEFAVALLAVVALALAVWVGVQAEQIRGLRVELDMQRIDVDVHARYLAEHVEAIDALTEGKAGARQVEEQA